MRRDRVQCHAEPGAGSSERRRSGRRHSSIERRRGQGTLQHPEFRGEGRIDSREAGQGHSRMASGTDRGGSGRLRTAPVRGSPEHGLRYEVTASLWPARSAPRRQMSARCAGCVGDGQYAKGRPLAARYLTCFRLSSSTTVMFVGGSTQLCYHCHEVTERTSDGDRVACSMCGRPYLIAPPSSAGALDTRSADMTSQD
jgi:hypothetical protein